MTGFAITGVSALPPVGLKISEHAALPRACMRLVHGCGAASTRANSGSAQTRACMRLVHGCGALPPEQCICPGGGAGHPPRCHGQGNGGGGGESGWSPSFGPRSRGVQVRGKSFPHATLDARLSPQDAKRRVAEEPHPGPSRMSMAARPGMLVCHFESSSM